MKAFLQSHAFTLGVALVTLLLIGLGVGRLTAVDRPPAALFTAVEPPAALAAQPLPANVLRQRFVHVNAEALKQAGGAGLSVPLFDDVQVAVLPVRTDVYANGGYVWVGSVAGREAANAAFSVFGQQMTANVNLGDALYRVEPVGDGVHAIRQLGGQPGIDGEPLLPEIAPAAAGEPDIAAPAADDGSIIDVLVVYTPAARNAAAGSGSINSLINLAVSESNTGFANSGVNPRLRLVHQAEVPYLESGSINTDLVRLAANGEFGSYMDQVHAWRNAYAADVVVLIINGQTTGFCGLAYLMNSLSTGFASSAFSVVAHDCATGYYSFGHEIGHNMGSQHDFANAGSQGVFPYGYGYQDPQADFRTIMAYNCPTSCTRVNHWSNPNVSYLGFGPTGLVNTADNRQSLNNAAFTVANFRQSSSAATPTPTPSPTPTTTPTSTPTPTPTPTFTPTPLPQAAITLQPGNNGDIQTNDTSLNFPPGLVDNPVDLLYLALDPEDLPATPPAPLINTKYQFQIVATYAGSGLPAEPVPGQSYQVTITYTDDGRNLAKEATLALYFWDPDQEVWLLEAVSSNINLSSNTLSASLDRFGTWAVLGEGPERVFLPLNQR